VARGAGGAGVGRGGVGRSFGAGGALLPQGLGYTVPQSIRYPILAAIGHQLAELSLKPIGADARPAQVEVAGDLDATLLGQFAVEVGVEPLDRLLAADEAGQGFGRARSSHLIRYAVSFKSHPQSPHYLDSSDAPTRPRALPTSTNAFCRAFLPRWILLMTVPIGTSVISAISL